MNLILVRHGQTEANARRLLQGRVDLPLTELGRRQARAAASVLSPGAAIVTSPLRRARETAEVMVEAAVALGLTVGDVTVDERWIELDYGSFDGRPLDEVPGDVWDRWRSDLDFAAPAGESLRQCGARVRVACEDLAGAGADRTVVVVSHVSPIKAAVAWALGVSDATSWRMLLDVAAVCRVGVGPRGPSLQSFNDRTHLAGVG